MNSKKIIVFDMDETLGFFIELQIIWFSLCNTISNIEEKECIEEKLNKKELFFKLFDIFPEYLRPNILDILNYIYKMKKKEKIHKIMIYTNNKGPKEWANLISEYFNYKLNEKVFDNIIAAFKVNGKIIEICRKSNKKSVEDIIECTNIPKNTNICFIDDQYHPLMNDERVYYIQIKPYIYSHSQEIVIDRIRDFILNNKLFMFMNTNTNTNTNINTNTNTNINFIINNFIEKINNYNYKFNNKKIENDTEIIIDTITSKTLFKHIHIFINDDNTKNKLQYTDTIRNKKHTRKLKNSKLKSNKKTKQNKT